MTSPSELQTRLLAALPQHGETVVREAVKAARQLGLPLYLVGGGVRDLLMGRSVKDIDLVVEGDAGPLASALAAALAGKVTARSQFGTFKVSALGMELDVVTARRETYKKPGALPTVSPDAIADDLWRRDFTINAMALRLEPAPTQRLDPTGGQRDIESKLVRILHDASFQDDATRMMRAVRYEQRLGFRLEEETEALLRRDLRMLDTISGDRLRHELLLIFQEEATNLMLLRTAELGLLAAVHSGLPDVKELTRRLERLAASLQPTHYVAVLAYSLDDHEREGFIQRLKMPATWAKAVRDVASARDAAGVLAGERSPAAAYRKLHGLSVEAIQVAASLAPLEGSRHALERYVNEWRHVRPLLSGRDLERLGLPPGPRIGEMLAALRDARLEGRVHTREDEEAFVQERR